MRFLMFVTGVCVSFFFSAAVHAYDCNYDNVTAKPEDGYFLCYNTCPAQITVTLSCTAPHVYNWCNKHCASAVDNSCPAKAGNPINLSTGAKEQVETDFRGVGGMPLEIVRSYSSHSIAPSSNWGQKWGGVATPQVISTNNNLDGDTYTYVDEHGERTHFKLIPNSGFQTRPVKSNTAIRLVYANTDSQSIPQVWTVEFPDGRERVFEFNLNQFVANKRYQSRLLWKTDIQNGYHNYYYDAQNRISIIRNHVGEELRYTYYSDGSNRIQTITAPGTKVFRYEYDGVGNLVRVYYPDSTTSDDTDNPYKQYHYEDSRFPHHMTGITNENGQRYATYAYDSSGRAVLSSHAGDAGRIEVLEYGDNVRVRNSAGQETVYQFQNVGSGESVRRQLVAINGEATANCGASNSRTTYDSAGFKDYVVDGRGFATDYTIDAQGREVRRREAMLLSGSTLVPTSETRAIETDWATFSSPNGNHTLVSERREPGKTSRYTYENGRVKTLTEIDTTTNAVPYSTNGQSRTWVYQYTYHDSAQLIPATIRREGPRTDVANAVVQHFDSRGLLTRVDRVFGSVTLTSIIGNHDPSGLPRRIVDENGVETLLTYTPRGWIETRTVVTAQGNAVTRYSYDSVGQVIKIRLPNSNELNYGYDAAQRKIAVFTNQGERIDYDLDTFGNVLAERASTSTGEIRRLQRQEFDDLGRLWKVIGVENQELLQNSYDENGNVVAIADANQRSIVQSFDGLNRLSSVTDRESGVVEYQYDGQNNLVSVQDQNGLQTAYVVDGFGRRIQQISPDTGVTVNRYDLADNLVESEDARGIVTRYTYDGLNRLVSVTYPASLQENITYRYDEVTTAGLVNLGLGRMTGVTEASGNRIDWIYDQLGNVVRDIRTIAGRSYTTRYQYDLAGYLTNLIYPSGREVNYQYDTQGRITTVRTRASTTAAWANLATNIQYEPFGPVRAFTYGNGMAQANQYDMHYRPAALSARNGSVVIQGLEFGFNLNNELDLVTNLANPMYNQSFGYDGNSRLEQATGQYGVLAYDYDGVGNRLGVMATGYSENYSYPVDSHRLSGVSGTNGGQNRAFTYSAVGNIAADGTYNYDYNHRNRLVAVRQGQSTVAGYTLNALGQRIAKSVGAAVTHFHYGLDNKLLAESQGDGTPVRDYVYMGNQLLSMIDVEPVVTVPQADLGITLNHVRNGLVVDYTLTVTNAGPDQAAAVRLQNSIPADTTLNSYTVSAGSCSQSGQQLDCQLGTMANGTVNTLQVQITAEASVNINDTVTASVSSATADPNMNNNSLKRSGSGCFIATAAYGHIDHQYVQVLRSFRDDYLLTNEPGQAFVETYYTYSPPIADWIAEREAPKAIVRVLLMPLIALAWLVQAPMLVQAMVLLMLGGLFWLWKQGALGALAKKGMASAGLLLALLAGNASADQIYYVHGDHLNVPNVVTNQSRQVVWEGHRKPFGETEVSVASIRQPFRFPGQYFDSETGLHYNLMRDYDPRTGRYVQSDPIGLAGGMNTYAYAGQNPIMAYDPSGQFLWFLVMAGGATAAENMVWGLLGLGLVYATVHDVSNITSNSTTGETCDDCTRITQSIEALANEVEMRYEDLLIDRWGLYGAPYPDPDFGSWDGHVEKYLDVQRELRLQISFAKSKPCPVSAEAESWSVEPPPTAPFSG